MTSPRFDLLAAVRASAVYHKLNAGAVFTVATVLIIYYKQITEGYEDKSRFEIMEKVGMTEKDIRKSINSQLLLVFFIPLVFSGLHLMCAFNVVRQLLTLFSLDNVGLFMLTT